jgi:hypothetical protein
VHVMDFIISGFSVFLHWVFMNVYYESRKRELKISFMNEGRCDDIGLFTMNR